MSDNAYITEITVGTPPQVIKALFDTGSTNTWILNSKTDIGTEKPRSYDNSKSSTFKVAEPAQDANISFGSGNLSGNFVTDSVTLGQCKGGNGKITIPNQKFGNVLQQSTIFTGRNFEAIVGLAYP